MQYILLLFTCVCDVIVFLQDFNQKKKTFFLTRNDQRRSCPTIEESDIASMSYLNKTFLKTATTKTIKEFFITFS